MIDIEMKVRTVDSYDTRINAIKQTLNQLMSAVDETREC